MLLKYNLSSQLTDNIVSDIKWVTPNAINLADDNMYQINSTVIVKGDPFTLSFGANTINTVRYLVIESANSYTLSIDSGPEYLTKFFVMDVGVYRPGFTNISKINNIKISNPTGISTAGGVQFTNPQTIEVKYLLVLEKL